MKILHIISDDKFIDTHIDKFKFIEFESTFVYLKENNTYKGKYAGLLQHIKPSSKEYVQINSNIMSFDAIFTNGLGYQQSVFINQLSSNHPKVFWCFFGAEIYNNPKIWSKEDLYSSETLKTVKKQKVKKIFQKLYHLRFIFKNGKNIHSEIRSAISKCSYFVWYVKEEYDYIQGKIAFKLPEFKYLMIENRFLNLDQVYSKKDKILLGNSASEANNHIDALIIFEKSKCNCEISIPFSYGVKNWYRNEVLEVAKRNPKVSLIENFVPYEQYMINFEEAKAAVYPSYRQMGLGNIVMCIRSGVKIYLSVRNPIYKWFVNNNIAVYTMEDDLDKDILNNNLQLKQEEIIQNKLAWNELASRQNREEFFKMIIRSK